jgi:hypothetical protein
MYGSQPSADPVFVLHTEEGVGAPSMAAKIGGPVVDEILRQSSMWRQVPARDCEELLVVELSTALEEEYAVNWRDGNRVAIGRLQLCRAHGGRI